MKQFNLEWIKTIGVLSMVVAAQSIGFATGITLPAPQYFGLVGYPSQKVSAPGVYSTGTGATLTVAIVPAPFVNFSVTQNSVNNESANIRFFYPFEYTGPDGTIPISISYLMSYSGDFNTFGDILDEVSVYSDPGHNGSPVALAQIDNYQSGLSQQQVTGTLQFNLTTNQLYWIKLTTGAGVQPGTTGVSANGTVDPVISIDPSFAGDPSLYSLSLPSGFGNTTGGTPEPSTALLAASGIAIAAFAKKFRARK